MDESQINLIAEQLKNAIITQRASLQALEAELKHQRELANHRLELLEQAARDHETRIRAATDGVTQFKVWSGLATGGSWIVSAMALLKAWFGG